MAGLTVTCLTCGLKQFSNEGSMNGKYSLLADHATLTMDVSEAMSEELASTLLYCQCRS